MKCYISTLRCTVRFTAWLVDSCFSSEFVCSWIPWWNEPVAFYRPHCLLLCFYFSEHHPHDTFYQFRSPKRLVIYHLRSKELLIFLCRLLTHPPSYMLHHLTCHLCPFLLLENCENCRLSSTFLQLFVPTGQFCLCIN